MTAILAVFLMQIEKGILVVNPHVQIRKVEGFKLEVASCLALQPLPKKASEWPNLISKIQFKKSSSSSWTWLYTWQISIAQSPMVQGKHSFSLSVCRGVRQQLRRSSPAVWLSLWNRCRTFDLDCSKVLQLLFEFWSKMKQELGDLLGPLHGASLPSAAFFEPSAVDANPTVRQTINATIGTEPLVDDVASFSSFLNDCPDLWSDLGLNVSGSSPEISAPNFHCDSSSVSGSVPTSPASNSTDLLTESSSEMTGFFLERSRNVVSQRHQFPTTFPQPTTSISPCSPMPSFTKISPLDLLQPTVHAVVAEADPPSGSSFLSLDKKPVTPEDKKRRKRELNRRAAMRCRQRKVERERELEGMVMTLRQKNAELLEKVVSVGSKAASLEKLLVQHVASGCASLHLKTNSVSDWEVRTNALGTSSFSQLPDIVCMCCRHSALYAFFLFESSSFVLLRAVEYGTKEQTGLRKRSMPLSPFWRATGWFLVV